MIKLELNVLQITINPKINEKNKNKFKLDFSQRQIKSHAILVIISVILVLFIYYYIINNIILYNIIVFNNIFN